MKSKSTFCAFLLFLIVFFNHTLGYSQVPQGFSYQAIVRDAAGSPIVNKTIGVKITLEDAQHVAYYIETQSKQTNAQGVLSFIIGTGNKVGDALFENIPWINGDVSLKLEIDPQGGINYTQIGEITKLQAVPYALFADNNKLVTSPADATDTDPVFVVKNKLGQIVFAVYQSGVRMYVDDLGVKGAKGGFAVGGLTSKANESAEYFTITPDSARIRVRDLGKGAKGGFAVGGLTGKSGSDQYLDLTESNYLIGHQAGKNITSGLYNSFMGYQTGVLTTSGNTNTFIGYQAGLNNKSRSSNTFLGNKAGYSHWTGATGNRNVFIGDSTGYNNLEGYDNVFLGSQVGPANMDGHSNVFLGYRAGYSNWGGYSNVFIGKEAGYNASLGYDNVYIGYRTGYEGHGQYNVYIGHEAGLSNAGGSLNTFIGKSAGRSHTDGDYNVFLGLESGFGNITGERNVFLGYSAGSQETGSDKLYISNSSTTTPLIWGDFATGQLGIRRQATTNAFEVEGEASKTFAGSWVANSDRRIKTDIIDISNAFETVLKLRPVKFRYTDEYITKHPTIVNKYYYNFIAQEFQQVFPEAVKGSGEYLDGDSKEILQIDTYNAQIVTIKAVQELILENQKQQKEIEALKAEIESIKLLLKK